MEELKSEQYLTALMQDYGRKQVHTRKFISEIDHRDISLLSKSFYNIYCISTCAFGCNNGNHIMESFAGRIYNLGVSAFYLTSLHFYDEAFLLIRSIGEISNLVLLFNSDYPKAFEEWIALDETDRIRKFAPSKVRIRLQALGLDNIMPISKEEYSLFSGKYVHIKPDTKPNAHDNAAQATIGGVSQKRGFIDAMNALLLQVPTSALHLANSVNNKQVIEEISKIIKHYRK